MPLDTSLLGQPVELGQIGRELKKLWEGAGGVDSRASLVNFAVLCRGPEALEANTKLISGFTKEHACRAILLARIDEPGAPAVRTWINAHCHLTRAGAKQVCCEQFTFVLNGDSDRLVSNVLYANLDSDLPLYLWWQGELSPETDEKLWSSVDRLIFDSGEWSDMAAQFALLQSALKAGSSRLILCDLNWTRTLHLRQAVAQMFDQPGNLSLLCEIRRVAIRHSPGGASTALLFACWIAAQLGWSATERDGSRLRFVGTDGGKFVCELSESAGAPISQFEIESAGGTVTIQRDPGAPFFRAEVRHAGGLTSSHLLPASTDDLVTLLDEELTLGGRHRVYLKALRTLEPLLSAPSMA